MPVLQYGMMSYQEAESILGKLPLVKLGGTATYLIRSEKYPDSYAIRFHTSEVVIIHPDGSYSINSGGWHTATTKSRINEYSPAHVEQRSRVWYVEGEPFADFMRVNERGEVIGYE